MSKVYTQIQMDVTKPLATQTIHVMQGDSGSRFITVTLFNDGQRMDLSADAAATLNGITTAGESFSTIGQINADGSVTIPIDDWMLVQDDKITCTISISGQSGEILTVFPFVIVVHQSMAGHEITYTATENDLLAGKTAYVNGRKILGTIETYNGITEVKNNVLLDTANKYVLKNILVNIKEGGEDIMEITTSSVLINDLDVGIYKLTYNGPVFLYIDSEISHNSIRLSGTNRILIVATDSGNEKSWYAFDYFGGQPVVQYGITPKEHGSGSCRIFMPNETPIKSEVTNEVTEAVNTVRNEMPTVLEEVLSDKLTRDMLETMYRRNPIRIYINDGINDFEGEIIRTYNTSGGGYAYTLRYYNNQGNQQWVNVGDNITIRYFYLGQSQ